ncbi:MAG: hypothetical protein SGJ18_13915 [Pseudomonadota bacterium]|nr:hypothetical protein [Pseudomonadota bacterium]
MSSSITLRTCGKWILCGEHSVLRGSPAIAFPFQSQFFLIEFLKNDQPLSLVSVGSGDLPHLEPFSKALDRGLSLLTKMRQDLPGTISANANITLGAGLGGSATLCVTVGRLFAELGWLKTLELFNFCRELENVFHGKSSGLDVAVILAGQGIHFEMSGDYHLIKNNWTPNWFLSYSGVSSGTANDIEKVRKFILQNTGEGRNTDELMTASAVLAERALGCSEAEGLPYLVKSIDQAGQCFFRWGLPPNQMISQIEKIKAAGALAAKPTGSGGGGYILSLWPSGITPKVEGIVFYKA